MEIVADMRGVGVEYGLKYADVLYGLPLSTDSHINGHKYVDRSFETIHLRFEFSLLCLFAVLPSTN